MLAPIPAISLVQQHGTMYLLVDAYMVRLLVSTEVFKYLPQDKGVDKTGTFAWMRNYLFFFGMMDTTAPTCIELRSNDNR